ncbi:spherulin 4-like cell surface [Truncatella angustata]|uniref:Spherulin 4-like cell surface n=1 Tax=Truncatella angustata TaxID=152316 RepID=A0A9P8UJK9_9PEZI|nr:spherulin 4-like cell surface [Truncatella angustata]KAH6653294.1 spherulin 4-like cell surface [Truncatella angustata]KAH8193859.1 hypothetical protein TruAng_011974 [Truncatella angustata]
MKPIDLIATFAAAAFASTGILLPLYEYPYGDAAIADWDAVVAAAVAYPKLDFHVIVNINSGPSYDPNPPAGIKDFAPYLGSLNAHGNVKLIGYIATKYGSKSTSEVQAAVDQYSAWTTAEAWTGTSYDIHLDGIFFDEIDTTTGQLEHNTQISRYAKSKFADKGGPIVLNPGTFVRNGSESLFDVADAVLEIEACYTRSAGRPDWDGYACDPSKSGYFPFTPGTLEKLGTNATRVARSSVVVHDFYNSWSPYTPVSEQMLQTYVDAVVAKGVHSFYLAQLGYLGNFTAEPASITTVARLAAAAQGFA